MPLRFRFPLAEVMAAETMARHPGVTSQHLSPTKSNGTALRERAEVKALESPSPRAIDHVPVLRRRGSVMKKCEAVTSCGDSLRSSSGVVTNSGEALPTDQRQGIQNKGVEGECVILPDQQYEEASVAPLSTSAVSPSSPPPSSSPLLSHVRAETPATSAIANDQTLKTDRRRVSSQERDVRRQMQHMLWCRELLRTFRARPEFFCQFRGGGTADSGGGRPCWLPTQSPAAAPAADPDTGRRQSADQAMSPPPTAPVPAATCGQLRRVRSRSTPDLRRLSAARRSGDSAFSELGAESDSPQTSNDSGKPETGKSDAYPGGLLVVPFQLRYHFLKPLFSRHFTARSHAHTFS